MVTLLRTILEDLQRYEETYRIRNEKKSLAKIALESVVFKPGFQAVLLYRVSNFFYKNGLGHLAWLTARINQALTSAEIEYNADIAPGLFIAHPAGIVIGRGSKVGRKVNLYQCVTLGTKDMNKIEYPTIEDHVTLFSGAQVLGNTRVGQYAVVGANSVVVTDVPAHALVAGKTVLPNRGDKVVAFAKD